MLPLGWALALGRVLGLIWYYLIPLRRDVALANVARTVGRDLSPREQRRIVRNAFQRQGMYVMELLRLPALTREVCEELIEVQNRAVVEAALAKGRGVILVASHLDNVDLAGCGLSVCGLPIAVVAKELGFKPAARFIVAVREATGVMLIPTGKSRGRIRELLAQNHVVALVIDQHIRPQHSIVCRFFDQLAATSHAPARFAAETGAALVTGVIHRVGMTGKHVIRFEDLPLETPFDDPAANIRHNTERINRIVEGWIREYPEQWLWPHRRFKVHDAPEGWDVPDALQELAKR